MEDGIVKYDGLCISSGGFKGLGILGTLTTFDAYGYLDECKHFSGCSVGAIIVYLYALGWSPSKLYQRVNDIKLFDSIRDFNIDKFQFKHGLMDNKHLRHELEALVIEARLQEKIKIPTLLDLHNEGIYIAFSITDRVTDHNVKLDWKSHPHLKSTEACLMSANIPLLYEPMEYNGMLCSDGAMTNPFPIDYIDNGRRKILAISVFGDKHPQDEGILQNLTRTMMISVEQLQKRSTKSCTKFVDVMEMIIKDISYFDQSSEESNVAKLKMYKRGLKDGKLMHHVLRRAPTKTSKPSIPDTKSHKLKGKKVANTKHDLPVPEDILVESLMHPVFELVYRASVQDPENFDNILKRLPREKQIKLHRLSDHLRNHREKQTVPSPREPEPVEEQPVMRKDVAEREHRQRRRPRQSRPRIPSSSSKVEEVEENTHSYSRPNTVEEPFETVNIAGSHVERIFNTLPQDQRITAQFIGSLIPANQLGRWIRGVDIFVEGIQMITGESISDSINFSSSSNRDSIGPRVEIIDD